MAEAKKEKKFTKDKLLFDSLMKRGNDLASSASPEQLAYLTKARQILQTSPPQVIYEEDLKYPATSAILPGTYPFLYCRMRRSGRGMLGYNTTDELGPLANNTDTAAKMFKNFTGGNDGPLDTYTIPPSLEFVGPQARWVKAEGWLERWVNADNQINYPSYDLILMFLKNTTELPLTRTFYRYLSSDDENGAYTSASSYLGVPNQSDENRDKTTDIQWTQVHTKSGDINGEAANFAVTIPEGKTVALLLNSSSYYYTPGSYHYAFYSAIGIYDFDKFLTAGLEVDHERTMKALQHKTINTYEIWR